METPAHVAGSEAGALDHAAAERGPEEVVVRVRNNVIPISIAWVRVKPAFRPEHILGSIHTNAVGTYTIDTRLYAGSYVLVAKMGDGRTFTSREINVLNRAIVSWNLDLNLVLVERDEPRD